MIVAMLPRLPFVASVLFGSVASAQVADLQRCPSIADPVARLACYDAAMPPTAARPAEPAAALRPTTPPAPARADAFGLPQSPAVAEAQTVQSTTVANFFGWGPKEKIRLQNGQLWEVIDGSSGTLGAPNTKVTVRKGLFGAFIMEFEGLNRAPRVRRLE
jgi:hypothetical protein